jgi:methionyl-tRNA synthetase
MYVWCDALTNYISGIDIFGLASHAKLPAGSEVWWDDAEVTHVIGKDIARFHALIWPAMLKAAKVRTPDRLLIHGFLTSEGQKMSKSLGNVVKPEEVLAHFGGNADPLRFYLSHEVPVGNDGDFSWKRIDEVYTAKLGNQLGNMLNRVLVMLKKENIALSIPGGPDDAKGTEEQWKQYADKLDAFDLSGALQHVTSGVDAMNRAFNDAQPWKLTGDKKIETLSTFAECLRHVALMLLPFVPETAQKMSRQLGLPYSEKMLEKSFVFTKDMMAWNGIKGWKTTGEPSILFPPLEKK